MSSQHRRHISSSSPSLGHSPRRSVFRTGTGTSKVAAGIGNNGGRGGTQNLPVFRLGMGLQALLPFEDQVAGLAEKEVVSCLAMLGNFVTSKTDEAAQRTP